MLIHSQSYIWNVLHASRLYGCVEYAMYQVDIPAWQDGIHVATDLLIDWVTHTNTTKYYVATWCIYSMK